MKLKLTQKTRKRLILLTVVLEVILAALVIYGIYSGTLRSSLAGGTVMILLLHAAPFFRRERDDVTALGFALMVLLLQM